MVTYMIFSSYQVTMTLTGVNEVVLVPDFFVLRLDLPDDLKLDDVSAEDPNPLDDDDDDNVSVSDKKKEKNKKKTTDTKEKKQTFAKDSKEKKEKKKR